MFVCKKFLFKFDGCLCPIDHPDILISIKVTYTHLTDYFVLFAKDILSISCGFLTGPITPPPISLKKKKIIKEVFAIYFCRLATQELGDIVTIIRLFLNILY